MTESEAHAYLSTFVSRETLDRLQIYVDMLVKWQKAINLVAPATLPDAWSRHIVDSAQIFPLAAKSSGKWLDMGSGGGFPGLVCAIIAAEKSPDISFHFIESDLRKCAFLRDVARQVGISINVMSRRIEDAPPQNADIISARALSDLSKLCTLSYRHLATDGQCLFLKGQSAPQEIDTAKESWQMSIKTHPSVTSDDGQIIEIKELRRV